ncbi:MAG: tRNA (adenosine(37)-N6)-threonylcarbamoyltransferase complex dimerization subunit type 1 TsaB [Nostocoides sp.]
MLLLALDTATSAITVAVHDGDSIRASAAVADARRHTEELAPLIQRVMRAAGAGMDDVTDVAVGTGPGPFTGLRVGLVTAQVLGASLGLPVHGVASLDALAHAVVRRGVVGEPFAVATDARRKEVYWATYAAPVQGSADPLTEPAVHRPAVIPPTVRAGPCAGRGPVLFPDLFARPVPVLDVDAEALADLAVRRLAAGMDMPVQARYLRRPDALTLAERAAT